MLELLPRALLELVDYLKRLLVCLQRLLSLFTMLAPAVEVRVQCPVGRCSRRRLAQLQVADTCYHDVDSVWQICTATSCHNDYNNKRHTA